jgi:hypothetical protein
MTTSSAPAPTPFTRFAVPAASKLDLTSGTYFRLGSYVDGDESALFPPASLVYTTSVVTSTPQSLPDLSDAKAAAEAYNTVASDTPTTVSTSGSTSTTPTTADGNIIVNDGTPATNAAGKRIRNSTRQFEINKISVTPTAGTLLKKGIFAKTDGDIIATADGGAVIDLEQGFALTSQKGDFSISLPEGYAKIVTKNGIELQAGNATVASNIALTAFGYIKQAAYGPMDDVRFATSSMKTYGWTKEWFYGEKYSEFHGKSESKFYGDEIKYTQGTSTSTFLGNSFTSFNGLRETITVAGSTNIAVSGDFGFHFGLKMDLNIGLYLKIQVIGEAKIFGIIDFKMGAIDLKMVHFDLKMYNGEAKAGFFRAKANTSEAEAKALLAKSEALQAKIGAVAGDIYAWFKS